MSLRFFTNQRPPLANDIKVFTFYATAPFERRASGGRARRRAGVRARGRVVAVGRPTGGRGWSVDAIIYDPDTLNM